MKIPIGVSLVISSLFLPVYPSYTKHMSIYINKFHIVFSVSNDIKSRIGIIHVAKYKSFHRQPDE